MFSKIAFSMYPVQNVERARDFYENTLGLKRGLSTPNGMWTEYDLPGGGCLALFMTDQIQPSSTAGGSVALEVGDLDACMAQLREKGVRFVEKEVIQSPVCRMMPILDSEGNALLLHELKPKA